MRFALILYNGLLISHATRENALGCAFGRLGQLGQIVTREQSEKGRIRKRGVPLRSSKHPHRTDATMWGGLSLRSGCVEGSSWDGLEHEKVPGS